MKHIKSYKLFESLESEMNFDKIVEILSTECSEFLTLLEEKNIKGLYRGATIHDTPIVDGFWKFKPFENRLSRDTKLQISKLLDKGFVNKFGIPLRSRGVFATKDLSIARDYGRFKKEAFLFFPKNGFRYFWNPQIDDLYDVLSLGEIGDFYYKDTFDWNSSDWKTFDSIIDGYQEGEIEKVKWHELTFICDEYYMLDLDYYDKFLDYFIK
jgi:hypothetical protein